MQVVVGTRFIATAFATLCASSPAEKEIGIEAPSASRSRRTRFIVMTCSGGPDRYITSSVKKVRWFFTTSVLLHFTASRRPRSSRATSWSRGIIAQRIRELQVLVERLRRRLDLRVAHDVVQQVVHRLPAEQRGVQLDADVDAHLGEEVGDDPLDLVGRAAVEGRQRDGVADAGGEGQVPVLRQGPGEPRAQLVHDRRGVLHRPDPAAHALRPDALEVVADAHVVERVELAGRGRRRARATLFRISMSIAAPTYSRSDASSRSSCDHSTL